MLGLLCTNLSVIYIFLFFYHYNWFYFSLCAYYLQNNYHYLLYYDICLFHSTKQSIARAYTCAVRSINNGSHNYVCEHCNSWCLILIANYFRTEPLRRAFTNNYVCSTLLCFCRWNIHPSKSSFKGQNWIMWWDNRWIPTQQRWGGGGETNFFFLIDPPFLTSWKTRGWDLGILVNPAPSSTRCYSTLSFVICGNEYTCGWHPKIALMRFNGYASRHYGNSKTNRSSK